MLQVGLTGGIATGKSRVLRGFAAAGFLTVDLDSVAHEVIAPSGAAYADVVAAFGPKVLAPDGTIDRTVLGAIVFSDASARERLNAIVHPRVREEEARRIGAHRATGGAAVVTDAALLIEVGIHLRFDRLVVVHCAPALQVERLMARDGLEEGAARARLAAQMPAEAKRRFAHYAIDSSGSLGETDAAAGRTARELRALARGRPGRTTLGLEGLLGGLVLGPARGPRGLEPPSVLAEVATAGGVDMERLKRLLAPPTAGPWYEAGAQGLETAGEAPAPGPEALAAAVLPWALARVGADAPFLAGAMASIGWLTTHDPSAIAGGCQFALALLECAVARRVLVSEADLRVWSAIGERWGGAPPPPRIRAAVEAAARHPHDVEQAREAARASSSDPSLAAALVAVATGSGADRAPQTLVETVQRVTRAA